MKLEYCILTISEGFYFDRGKGVGVQYQFMQLTDVRYGFFCHVCNRSMEVALVCKEIELALGSFGSFGGIIGVKHEQKHVDRESVQYSSVGPLYTVK